MRSTRVMTINSCTNYRIGSKKYSMESSRQHVYLNVRCMDFPVLTHQTSRSTTKKYAIFKTHIFDKDVKDRLNQERTRVENLYMISQKDSMWIYFYLLGLNCFCFLFFIYFVSRYLFIRDIFYVKVEVLG